MLSCLPVLPGTDLNLAGQEVRLTLLHTSDIHSRILPYDFAPLKTDTDLGLIPEAGPFGGAARLGALIKRERTKGERVLHLDSGDCFQGAPIFNQNLGEVEFKFLSKMRLDAAVVGNHEFDAGALNFTIQARDHALFPLLAANYVWDDYRDPNSNQTGLYTAPYTIKVVKGVRVGVIGMANISSLNSIVEGGNSLQATPIEQNEAARAYVELLKPVTDLIVIVSHLGLTEDQDLIQGYDAYYQYKKVKGFLNRKVNAWEVLQWFGEPFADDSVVQVKIPGVVGIDVVLGGHLHVVLNPPQLLSDPSGRKVVLSHSGAFAKYLGRLDLVVKMPPPEGDPNGAEVLTHDYRVFPVDSLWCDDAMHAYYKEKFWGPGEFANDPQVKAAIARCSNSEDRETTALMQPYIVGLDLNLALTSMFGFAPRDISRRNNSSGGDSPLGNLAADSMRKRHRVDAEVGITNSLGIRDNLYAGPLTQESMFNVFPFENTINIMYLSGVEMQEMFDFVAERSASRGCQSQAQVSGVRFTMDCAQVQLNDLRLPCDPKRPTAELASECPKENREGHAPWTCLDDISTGGRCWAHPAVDVSISGKPLSATGTYKVAVNDYIAKGGSGFAVLKRNTTRLETGISLRDSLVGYMEGLCTCDDVLAGRKDAQGNIVGAREQPCGGRVGDHWEVDDQVKSFCAGTAAFADMLARKVQSCTCKEVLAGRVAGCGFTQLTPEILAQCTELQGPSLGRCSCLDALQTRDGNPTRCGASVTQQLRQFCEAPTSMAIAVGYEDGRIGRRVK